MPVTGVIDTGASVSLLSPSLVKLVQPAPSGKKLMCHGIDGPSEKRLLHFSITLGDFNKDCQAVEMAGSFLGYDLVIGLDILLETGLTLSRGGEHRLDI